MLTYSLFPFDKVPQDSKIVIYGAGNIGKMYVHQLQAVRGGGGVWYLSIESGMKWHLFAMSR